MIGNNKCVRPRKIFFLHRHLNYELLYLHAGFFFFLDLDLNLNSLIYGHKKIISYITTRTRDPSFTFKKNDFLDRDLNQTSLISVQKIYFKDRDLKVFFHLHA